MWLGAFPEARSKREVAPSARGRADERERPVGAPAGLLVVPVWWTCDEPLDGPHATAPRHILDEGFISLYAGGGQEPLRG
jgi:hypothetical protein